MARRQRDYAAEERRRNELARQRGYTSRAQQRRRIETGKAPALDPKRLRKSTTIEAQKFFVAEDTKGRERKGYKLPVFGSRGSDRERAQDWSDLFARTHAAQYDPDNRPTGMSEAEYTAAYMAAFVEGPDRYTDVRHAGGSEALKYWFVNVVGYMQADEYETRYGEGK